MVKSKLGSIVGMTCPRCRKGKLFAHPYSWNNAYKMNATCGVCSQNYEPEPGYYYGAMFISYIITGWIFMIVGLTLAFGFGWTITQTLIAVAILTIMIHNIIFRLSRSLWIHIFIKYDPQAALAASKTHSD